MLRSILVPALLLAAVFPLAAQTTPFTKVADNTTPIPGGTGNFVTFSNMISLNANGDVAFSEANYYVPENDGIHFWTSSSGLISQVADSSTTIPSGTGEFNQFAFYGNGIEGDLLAFRGNGSSDQAGSRVDG